MLEFFRKYQKAFFIFITAALTLSFCFYGAYGATGRGERREKDVALGASIDGSVMSKLEIDRMARFLSSDYSDADFVRIGRVPNIFNDGVIRKDLLATGLAEMLVDAYPDHLADDIAARVERAKRFRPYVHPQVSYISAENMWRQFVPELVEKIDAVRKHDNPQKGFAALAAVFLEQKGFPTSMLRQFLAYQQNQHQGVQNDPAIQRGDLAVFHYHTLEDWFGDNFVRLSCQFIHNMALLAKSEGHKVTAAEAKADLLRHGMSTLKAQQGKDVSPEMLGDAWKRQLATLYIDEKDAVEVWQKVLLFRRLFDSVGGNVMLDRMMYQNYHDFASFSCEVEEYNLPEDLKLSSMRDLFLFQKYIELIAGERGLSLPKKLLPMEEIQKKTPEIVVQHYTVDVASAESGKAALDVGIREMWEWQEENWETIAKAFRQFSKKEGEDVHTALDRLPLEVRAKVDAYSRKKMIEANPKWYEEVLNGAKMETVELAIPYNGEVAELPGITDAKKLLLALNGKEYLDSYTQDGKIYYRLSVIEKKGESTVASFQEMKERGVLDKLLLSDLEKVYPKIRVSYPSTFLAGEEKWKPLDKVRDEVARIHYSPLLKEIEKDFRKRGGKLKGPSLKEADTFYIENRFAHAMESAAALLKNENTLPSDEDHWAISCTKKHVQRNEVEEHGGVFDLNEGEVSEVFVGMGRLPTFCRLLKKCGSDPKAVADDVKKGQRLLSDDAKRHYMVETLERIKEKGCIHLERPAS